MPKLPNIDSKKLLRALHKAGFLIVRQTGSHARMKHADGRKTTVAIHNRTIPTGTLRAILREAKISKDELLELL